MKTTNRRYRRKIRAARERMKGFVAALLGVLLLSSAPVAMAQVYGVRRTTAVVSTPNRTVVAHKTTVVAGRGVATTLPHGYIATLPGGYRPVYVSGVRYYSMGGVYYRPQIYGGSTVYVRVNL
jgi:hypothetical protein